MVVGSSMVEDASVEVGGSLVAGSVVDGSTDDDSVVVGSSDAVAVELSMMLTALEVGSTELVVLLITDDVKVDDSKDDSVVRGRHRLAMVMAARAGKNAMEARIVNDHKGIQVKTGCGRTQKRGKRVKVRMSLSQFFLTSPTLLYGTLSVLHSIHEKASAQSIGQQSTCWQTDFFFFFPLTETINWWLAELQGTIRA